MGRKIWYICLVGWKKVSILRLNIVNHMNSRKKEHFFRYVSYFNTYFGQDENYVFQNHICLVGTIKLTFSLYKGDKFRHVWLYKYVTLLFRHTVFAFYKSYIKICYSLHLYYHRLHKNTKERRKLIDMMLVLCLSVHLKVYFLQSFAHNDDFALS